MGIKKIKVLTLVSLFLLTSVSIYCALKEGRGGELTVAFLDVGQGDAIFIDSPSGNQVLIDGGPGKSILRELSKVMPFYDRSIDVVIATHPDADHIGGLPDVLERYEVDLFIESGVEGETALYRELEGKMEELKTPTQGRGADQNVAFEKIEARRNMIVELGGGAVLQVLFPDRDPLGMESNTSSIVARLVYGESEFLLTGDSPTSIENYLVSLEGQRLALSEFKKGQSLTLGSDVLKLGHHGSKTSSDPDFISAVNPQYAVISVGRENRYGHPSPQVLETLQKAGIKILRTDEDGRIIFKSDGVNLGVK